ncbi:MAG: T9SS type A sorting domain-containing protein [Muribaculaceae bacterium]|nr:T9SS type A sorting domain-containing protein [Muribaculaceae bacterium]
MRRLIPLSFLLVAFSAMSNPSWIIHPTFDGEITHIIETPEYVYYTSRTLPPDNNITPNYVSLFRYDKEGEETIALSNANLLNNGVIFDVIRNPEKGYIFTVDCDFGINIIYDDGKNIYIPDYKNANISQSKSVRTLTPDQSKGHIYMATDFGYVVINDVKHEIADSRNYGVAVQSVARLGKHLLLLSGNKLLVAPVDEPRFSLSDYTGVKEFYVPIGLYPLSENKCLLLSNGGAPHYLYLLSVNENGEIEIGEPWVGNFSGLEYTDDGVIMTTPDFLMRIDKEGQQTTANWPETLSTGKGTSGNFRDFWIADSRKGLKGLKLDQEKGWSLTFDYIAPNAPSPFLSSCMAQHPTEGLLVGNLGRDRANMDYVGKSPILISAYKDGRWSNLSAAYTAPEEPVVIEDPYGFSIDPDNPDYIYASSLHSGFARINLRDAKDVIHFVAPSHKNENETGYVPLLPDVASLENWSSSCSTPRFDSYGNLWTIYANYDLAKEYKLPLYCWEASDRKASKTAADVMLPKILYVDNIAPIHGEDLFPLVTSRNRNYLLYASLLWDSLIVLIDTAGTPTDPSDDRNVFWDHFVDQDGNEFEVHNIEQIYEDPATGYVWVGHSAGVFYFDPGTLISGAPRAIRIKVARNDGTNLADYLLHNVIVNDIVSDKEGNKWLATSGAGLVRTTSDGKKILEEYTTSNSPIPDNNILSLGYIRDTNSIVASTLKGLAEYRIGDNGGMAAGSEVKVYPNPVRPGYSGYITIEGLEDGALVKIVDAGGNMVKELGPVNGEKIEWDGTNLHFKKLNSGVYFILESSGDGTNNFSKVGKILMIN